MFKKTFHKNLLKAISYKLSAVNSGYTLIEVLISAGIFVVVMVIVFSTFSVNSDLRNQTKTIREASVSARYAVESIAREFRLANNYSITSGGSLIMQTYDEGVKTTREYKVGNCQLNDASGVANPNQAICVKEDSGDWQPITSGDISVSEELDSSGNPYPIFDDKGSGSSTTIQPFIMIKFVIESKTGKKISERFKQTIETTVVARSYSQSFGSAIPTEQQ